MTEGIEALATTRVIIKPAGKMSDQAVSEHATMGKVNRLFSGVCVCGGVGVWVGVVKMCVCACVCVCKLKC